MWLTVSSANGGSGRSVPVTGARFLVGRDPGCDLVVRDEQVSRRHASLEAREDGRTVLRNLSSRNGTFVDGRRVEEPVLLQGDEEIRIGRTVLRASALEPGSSGPAPTRAAAFVPAAAPGPAAAAPASHSAIQRLILEALTDEVKGIRALTRKGLLVRGLGAAAGSAVVAILWRLFA